MTLAALTIAGLLISLAALLLTYLITARSRARARRPSPWRYGSGAWHSPDNLPAVTRHATSVPTGSSLPSHWPNSNAVRNRPEHHPG